MEISSTFRAGAAAVVSIALFGSFTAIASPAQRNVSRGPILRIEAGAHMAAVTSVAADAAGRYLASASLDKTVRVWDLRTGTLSQTLRPPSIYGDEGKLFAVAISPDGADIACGGRTGASWNGSYSLYVFDRATGAMLRRVAGLPSPIASLAYSPGGVYLAAGCVTGGLRVYRTADGKLMGEDEKYAGRCRPVVFDPSAPPKHPQLASASVDGYVRVYALRADRLALQHKRYTGKQAIGGRQPYGISYSPDGTKLAVGYGDALRVDILSSRDLAPLYSASTAGLTGDCTSSVAWSSTGGALYAGGASKSASKRYAIRCWRGDGRGKLSDLIASDGAILDLAPVSGGGVAFASCDLRVGLFAADGALKMLKTAAIADFRDGGAGFALSADGGELSFAYKDGGASPASFSIRQRGLSAGPPSASLTPAVTKVDGVDIENWFSSPHPALNGKPIKIAGYENCQSVAIAPDRKSFVLGSDWSVYCFRVDGAKAWQVPASSAAWSVNVSLDGRLATAAMADGTIRWYRLSDGHELLAFYPHADGKRWLLWTPTGYYDCSPGAESLLGWQVNNGRDRAADFFPASCFREQFYRPDIISEILDLIDEKAAVAAANAEAGKRSVAATDLLSRLPPVVTILSPKSGDALSDGKVTLRYLLRTPSGEPATMMRALVDGRPAASGAMAMHVVSYGGRQGTLTVDVPRQDCSLSIIAENRFTASQPAIVHLHWQGKLPAQPSIAPSTPNATVPPVVAAQ